MSIWYAVCDALRLEFLSMNFMKNALLAVLIMAPLFGLMSTMIVTGRMSFFSDALGHSGFTGIAVGVLCGAALLIARAVGLAVVFALFVSIWALGAAAIAVVAGLAVAVVAAPVIAIRAAAVTLPLGLLLLGCGLVLLGLCVLGGLMAVELCRLLWQLTVWLAHKIKSLFIRKEEEK